MTAYRTVVAWALIASAAALTGCVRRTITLTSEPSGALVYMNDSEIGRTPVTVPFTYYGVYDVQLRRDGYQTIKTRTNVKAPWWQYPPIDLVAELFPVTDRHTYSYTLLPQPDGPVDPGAIMDRGLQMQGRLESGRNTPATRPSAPATPEDEAAPDLVPLEE